MKLYGTNTSPYVRKVRLVMLEKNIPHTYLIDVPGKPPTFGVESAPSVVHLPGDDYRMYFEQPYADPITNVMRPCVALALTP